MKGFSCILGLMFFLVLNTSCTSTSVEEVESFHYEAQVSPMEMQILELVNQHRDSIGLNTLEFDKIAYDFAIEHTKDMIDKNEISHDNFDRRSSDLTIAAKANYVSEIVGRNYITAEGIVNAWLESETHRKAIEGDYMYTAVSAKADSEGVFYFTQLFYR
ncbi:MAG TPA: CAP domain-containing protein [Muricauda sp.]|nr:CAP domain-containing protein [Allomuricauda aurea]MBC72184.1 serine protease [Allomuricauda sp.]HBU79892.1 CAP domain-containing protein [Allomuricauda sp.]|tara:strand:+ start:1083 stop:1562 length:480 start_codon:yes stop_codon:yes gene_type:complete